MLRYPAGLMVICVVAGCASQQALSPAAEARRAALTQQEALASLDAFITPSEERGGLCLIGKHRLESDGSPTLDTTKIRFDAYIATSPSVEVTGNVLAETGRVATNYNQELQRAVFDAAAIREIRVLPIKPHMTRFCRGYGPGYWVVLKPQAKTASVPELTVNAASDADLDILLSTLAYLSPDARIVSGVGM